MSVRITRNGSYVKALTRYEGLPTLQIGVTRKNSPRDDDTTNAMLLGYHQFGTENMPARRPLDVLKTDKGFKDAIRIAVKLAEPGVMKLAGVYGVDAVKGAIRAGLTPAVQKSTIDGRRVSKESTPLIDTEQFVNSISFEVKYK